ncbi:peptidase M1 [Flavobacterium suaedae]|uniref:Aminopeptidase N n=1 Tax=Flavobacterium suaedae TaxID=1767027 RepID=A0ABQ1JUR5_9FLAO|nr:M1 family aminopeptidase [Flavobacterium suaedae]GGB78631.1 peptidase M1 [Flavobacterium suaedae]
MRRNILLLCVFWVLTFTYAQQDDTVFNSLVEAEMKSAYQVSNFTANLNTGNYDIQYHRLDFEVDPAEHFITGTVTTTFIAKDDMETITFDLTDALTVSSVTMEGNALNFTQNTDDELVITFPSVIVEDSEATVVVNYSGQPPLSSDGFNTGTHNGIPEIWTLSQPYGAKDWWPCKQDLNDKINNIDVYITSPSEYERVSNGVVLNEVDNGNGTTTTHFQHNYPIPAYLIAIAVTEYLIFEQTAGTAPNTFPIINYVYPEAYDFVVPEQIPLTVDIMDLFEDLFETYPFHEEKYGHAQCGIGGGMEHTTISFMNGFYRELVAHELAHQWFGDKITCGSWQDIWLNEGFATYLSGLVIEDMDGNDAFTDWKEGRITNITAAPEGSVYVPAADTTSVGRVFSSRLSYNKGAMVTHMLRFKLGDTDFYQGIKNYLADEDLAFDYAKTPDLKEHLETASGTDLTEFFNDWIYGEGYPSYTITVQHYGEGQVKVTINQAQSHNSVSYFEMPVPIRLYGDGDAQQDVVLDNTSNGQEFVIAVPFTVTSFEFDPERNIISKDNQEMLNTTQIERLSTLSLYPNPATEVLSVRLPDGVAVKEAVFYNSLGQQVMTIAEKADWNIAKLDNGAYFITLKTNKGTKQLKFIKE